VNSFTTIAVLLGIIVVAGIARAVRTYRFVRRSVRVRARVVSVLDATVDDPDTGSQTSSTSRYVVEITGQGNRKRRVSLADAFGGSIADKFVSEDGTIAVIYDPRRPGVVRIDSPWALYFVPAFFCAPGVLFCMLCAYVWLRT
jgi:hypothetical protein